MSLWDSHRSAARVAIAFLLLLRFGIAQDTPAQPPAPPEGSVTVIGPVITMDPANPRATGVVVRRGRIESLGAPPEETENTPIPTRVVHLPPGAVVMPGIIESHAHLLGVGQARRRLDLGGTASPADVVDRVRQAAANTPDGKWILGRGWNQEAWPDHRFPDRGLLDAATDRHPVLLTRVDGHAVWVNSAALLAANIDERTAAPEGGEILKDGSGLPTGVLIDNAAGLVERLVDTAADPQTLIEDYLAAQAAALSLGITTFVDAGTTVGQLEALNLLYADRRMKMRVYAMLLVDDQRSLDAMLTRPPIKSAYDDRVAVRALKIYADGALGSRGAWLLAPYADRPDHSGLAVSSPAFVEAAALRALRLGYQLCVHAIGDRAVRETLDAFERAAARATPLEKLDHRFRIEHAQIVDPKDVPRFRKLAVYPSMQACHCTSDGPWVAARLGAARAAASAYPWRTLLDAGCIIPNGTDAPVEPLSPFANLFSAVTRFVRRGDALEAFGPEQRMNRYEALQSLTVWGAQAIFANDRRGRLRPGFQADLVILDRDPETCSVWELPSIRVLATVIAGEIVYMSSP